MSDEHAKKVKEWIAILKPVRLAIFQEWAEQLPHRSDDQTRALKIMTDLRQVINDMAYELPGMCEVRDLPGDLYEDRGYRHQDGSYEALPNAFLDDLTGGDDE